MLWKFSKEAAHKTQPETVNCRLLDMLAFFLPHNHRILASAGQSYCSPQATFCAGWGGNTQTRQCNVQLLLGSASQLRPAIKGILLKKQNKIFLNSSYILIFNYPCTKHTMPSNIALLIFVFIWFGCWD